MYRIPAAILAAFLLFFVVLRLLEPRFIFYPLKYPKGDWETQRYAFEIQDHFFETADSVRLHAWYLPRQDAIATILLFHGNAGNLSHRLDLLAKFRENLPVNIFIFDYRGYGRSEGKPSEAGLYRDGEAAYRYLTQKLSVSPDKLILFGRSLGGAVAVDLAQHEKAAGLILESTFSTGKDMARRMFGAIPVWWIMKIKLDSAGKIQNVKMPKLFLHGTRDELVPIELGKKLFALAPPPKKFVAIPGAKHNDIYETGGETYYQAIAEFILECISPKANLAAN